MDREYTAELHGVTYGLNSAFGYIYNDVHKRWVDGTPIITSSIVKIEGGYIYTLNSVYKIIKGEA